MIALTPLEQALVIWRRDAATTERQQRIDDVATLSETGVFSNRNIAHITGLDTSFVGELTKKRDKTGGRFNPDALPFMYDLRLQWAQTSTCDQAAVRVILDMGVSAAMLSKLTGISRTTLYKKARS